MCIRGSICTADGSYGIKGFVTDAVKDIDFDYFFTCGPEPMFKALESTIDKGCLLYTSRCV